MQEIKQWTKEKWISHNINRLFTEYLNSKDFDKFCEEQWRLYNDNE